MPSYVVYHEGQYGYWSTIVDAPISRLMNEDEFKVYYRDRYGSQGMRKLPERMERARKRGMSGLPPFDMSFEELAVGNRAGDGGTELAFDALLQYMTGPPDVR